MLHGFLVFLFVVVSILLIVTVLLQSGKGGGLSGTFGGGGGGVTGGVFGGRGAAPMLVKATTVFAVLFMLIAVALNFVKPGARTSESVIERVVPEAQQQQQSSQPAVPGQSQGAPAQQGSAIPGTPSGAAK